MTARLPVSLKTLMTPFPYAADVTDSLDVAADLMREHDIRHVPVTEKGVIVGVVSDVGIADASHREAAGACGDCATPAYVVDLNADLPDVLDAMVARRIDVVVVTRNARLAGIFTTIDVCAGFADCLRSLNPEPPPDEVA